MIFADTSALFTLLDADDRNHARAVRWFHGASVANEDVMTHNYVVTEAISLVHARFGGKLVGRLLREILAPVAVLWVEREHHAAATAILMDGRNKRPSFVDLVSFELMRDAGIDTAFAFDRDFKAAGFKTVP